MANPFVVKKIHPTIFQRFFRTERAGGLVLLLVGIASLALANSPLADAYQRLWQIPVTIGITEHSLSLTFHRSGDFLVLTSKGQQEALFALEYTSAGVTAPILRLEHALHNFSAFIVMPLFAFANAGVRIGKPTPKCRRHCWSPPRSCHWQTA
jgi:Na+/H+ antiporter NhaA